MKRILYLHSSSDLYGSDRSLLRTIQGLDRNRFEAIVCLPYQGPLSLILERLGIRVYIFNLGVLRRSGLTVNGILLNLFHFVLASVRISFIVHRHSVDLVHSNTSAVVAGGFAAHLTGRKHIWHVREILQNPVFIRKVLSYAILRFSEVVVGVSQSVIDNLAEDQPGIREKSKVIHNGIEASLYSDGCREKIRREYGIGESEILVGMIGRVSHWKGQSLFIQIAKRIIPENPRVIFMAVGSPFKGQQDELDRFENDVKKNNIQRKFIIQRFRDDIQDILAGFDIFILPSVLPDPLPTTVLEAMAAGKPVIANAHGGVIEMLENGKSGFLVEANNVEAMTSVVRRLVESQELRNRVGYEARHRVYAKFTLSAYTARINALYRALF